jgi:hypothetical protein
VYVWNRNGMTSVCVCVCKGSGLQVCMWSGSRMKVCCGEVMELTACFRRGVG